MVTNYYVKGQHIGKASSRGKNRGYTFIWAMPPGEFVALVADHFMSSHGPTDGCEICEAVEAIKQSATEDYDCIGEDCS